MDIRSIGRMPGFAFITSGVIMVRSFVCKSPCFTLSIVFLRVSRYALGANFMNHC